MYVTGYESGQELGRLKLRAPKVLKSAARAVARPVAKVAKVAAKVAVAPIRAVAVKPVQAALKSKTVRKVAAIGAAGAAAVYAPALLPVAVQAAAARQAAKLAAQQSEAAMLPAPGDYAPAQPGGAALEFRQAAQPGESMQRGVMPGANLVPGELSPAPLSGPAPGSRSLLSNPAVLAGGAAALVLVLVLSRRSR